MAGCLAAIVNPHARIIEAASSAPDNHKAVLRFRGDEVGRMTGIDFKKVRVHKSIWLEGREVQPSPRIANMYSKKVVGRILDRSIWNIDPVDRYVAPSDFHMRMLDMVGNRIEYGCKVHAINEKNIHLMTPMKTPGMDRTGDPIISTMPMNKLANSLHVNLKSNFAFKEIHTLRGKVKDCNVHQTVYFPGSLTPVYRATLTGNDLIIESRKGFETDPKDFSPVLTEYIFEVFAAFGISHDDVEFEKVTGSQQYGKIASIDEKERRKFISMATREYNIYSLGRFGLWKNVLLDDVANDIYVIKKLIEADHYDKLRESI